MLEMQESTLQGIQALESLPDHFASASSQRNAQDTALDRIQNSQVALLERNESMQAALQRMQQSITGSLSSLTFRENSSLDVLIEGRDLEKVILPLMLIKPSLAAAVRGIATEARMLISKSDSDWVLREIDDLLKDAHASAAYGGFRPRRQIYLRGDEDYWSDEHEIKSVPFYRSLPKKTRYGLLIVEWKRDATRGEVVHQFRFGYLGTPDLFDEPIGLVGSFSRLPGDQVRVKRQVRPVVVVPALSASFQCVRKNNVSGLKELFTHGLASPYDYHEGGHSLLSVSLQATHLARLCCI